MNEILSNPYFLLALLIIISAIAIPVTSPNKAVKLAANPNELTVENIVESGQYYLLIDIGMPDDSVFYYYKADTYNNFQKGNFCYQKKKADKQQKTELIQAVESYLKLHTDTKHKKLFELFKDMKP